MPTANTPVPGSVITWNGLQVQVKDRVLWYGVVQVYDNGVSETLRLQVQGAIPNLIGNTTGLKDANNKTVKVVGWPYWDARSLVNQVTAFYVDTWDYGSPTDYLTDPHTGLQSGISLSGAVSVGNTETQAVADAGGDVSKSGAQQANAQGALEQQKQAAGENVGPGGGVATDAYLTAVTDFQTQEARDKAAQIQAVSSGGLPSDFTPQNTVLPPSSPLQGTSAYEWIMLALTVAGLALLLFGGGKRK